MSFLAQNIYVYFTVQFWNRQKRKGLGIKFNCDYTVNNKQIWMIAEWRKFPSCKFEGRGGIVHKWTIHSGISTDLRIQTFIKILIIILVTDQTKVGDE